MLTERKPVIQDCDVDEEIQNFLNVGEAQMGFANEVIAKKAVENGEQKEEAIVS